MVGTDGRFYNEFYDFDEDGKLNLYEYCVMEEEAFGITNTSYDDSGDESYDNFGDE